MADQPDFVAAALKRIDRADAAMDDGLLDRAKHERSLAHVFAVLAAAPVWLESLEQVEGSEEPCRWCEDVNCSKREEHRRLYAGRETTWRRDA